VQQDHNRIGELGILNRQRAHDSIEVEDSALQQHDGWVVSTEFNHVKGVCDRARDAVNVPGDIRPLAVTVDRPNDSFTFSCDEVREMNYCRLPSPHRLLLLLLLFVSVVAGTRQRSFQGMLEAGPLGGALHL
jgi:hypothetical protein